MREQAYALVLRPGELRSADYPVDAVSGLGHDNFTGTSGLVSDAAVAGVTSKLGLLIGIDFPVVVNND